MYLKSQLFLVNMTRGSIKALILNSLLRSIILFALKKNINQTYYQSKTNLMDQDSM